MGESNFLEILRKSKMNMKEFSEHFSIPYRTVQNWKNGTAACPSYVLDLMEYKLDREREEKIMKKYELKENTCELRNRDDIHPGCTTEQANQDPVLVKAFDSKEEALAALSVLKSTVSDFPGTNGKTYYSIKEYYVEENDYDEDGDWVSGGDIWNFSEME